MIEDIKVTIFEKLMKVQSELKAPKGQRNSFGNYNYRNCEDILEAVKPLLEKQGLVLLLTDKIEMVGDRFYVRAKATVLNSDGEMSVEAYARESLDKKGMDQSQITGASSSYARKYALNGLFCIDDTKDDDGNECSRKEKISKISAENVLNIKKIIDEKELPVSKFLKFMQVENIEDIQEKDYTKAINLLNSSKGQQ
jgi:hypothetical protein